MLILTIIILCLILILIIFAVKTAYNPKLVFSLGDQRWVILYEKTVFEERIGEENGDYKFELRRILLPEWLNYFNNE